MQELLSSRPIFYEVLLGGDFVRKGEDVHRGDETKANGDYRGGGDQMPVIPFHRAPSRNLAKDHILNLAKDHILNSPETSASNAPPSNKKLIDKPKRMQFNLLTDSISNRFRPELWSLASPVEHFHQEQLLCTQGCWNAPRLFSESSQLNPALDAERIPTLSLRRKHA